MVLIFKTILSEIYAVSRSRFLVRKMAVLVFFLPLFGRDLFEVEGQELLLVGRFLLPVFAVGDAGLLP